MWKYTGNSYFNQPSTGERFEEDFDAYVMDGFDLSPTIHTIDEQDEIGSTQYNKVVARVNRAISVYTGRNLGDDWRILIFKDKKHPITIGKKYYFDNNWWLTYNSDTYKNFAASCIVKRCNNVLRWLDLHGNYYEEPAIFDLLIARARDQMSADDLINVQGYINVYTQLNSATEKIRENQRFLVGRKNNRMAYKVFGGGVRNFINNETMFDDSSAMLLLTMGSSHINFATDDMERGLANAFQLDHKINNIPISLNMAPSRTFQLSPTVYRDSSPVYGAGVLYSSSDESVATVTADGLITAVADGNCSIRVQYKNNLDVDGFTNINVSSAHTDYSIIITPTPSYVIEGRVETYTCTLYEGGVPTANPFVFSISDETTVPKANYEFKVLDENSFSVKCVKRSVYDELVINCVSGTHTAQARIVLRGMF